MQPVSSMSPIPPVSTEETPKRLYAQGPFGPFIPAPAEAKNAGKAASKKACNDPFIAYMLATYFGVEQEACSKDRQQGQALLNSFESDKPFDKPFIRRLVTAPFSASTWRRQEVTPLELPPLDPQIFRHSAQTLPVREEKTQEDPVTEGSGQAIERRVMRPAGMKLLEAAADRLDALFDTQLLNINSLSPTDRQKDLDLIKKYQHHLRITYTAPDFIYKPQNTTLPPDRSSAAILEELEEEGSDSEESLSAGSSRVRATTLQGTSESLETWSATRAIETVRCETSICEEGHAGLTFILAWEALKKEIGKIKPEEPPKATDLQKGCEFLFSLIRRMLSYDIIPYGTAVLGVLNSFADFLRIFSDNTALTYRNEVKQTLIRIFEDILAFSLEQELDMSAVDTLTTLAAINTQTTIDRINDATKAMTSVVGDGIQLHTQAVTSCIDAGTDTLRKDFQDGATAIVSELSILRQELANQRAASSSSPELDAAKERIAEQAAELARLRAENAKKDEINARQAATIEKLIEKLA